MEDLASQDGSASPPLPGYWPSRAPVGSATDYTSSNADIDEHLFGGYHKWVVPQIGWFIRENPIKIDDLGVPLFQEATIYLTSSDDL